MNAQSNHPIRTSQTRTTDPQFFGPEAGQHADCENQRPLGSTHACCADCRGQTAGVLVGDGPPCPAMSPSLAALHASQSMEPTNVAEERS